MKLGLGRISGPKFSVPNYGGKRAAGVKFLEVNDAIGWRIHSNEDNF